MENNKKPKIRFKGFTDDWEQRKLGEIADSFGYGLNVAAKTYDGINKYIRITDIDDESRSYKEEDLKSPDCDLYNAERYRLEKGDILFARTGASVGKTYIYNNSNEIIYFAGFLIRAKIRKCFSSDFIFFNTLTCKYKKFINIISQRSGQPGVNAQEYAEFEISLPVIKEQNQIGNLFQKLDHLIALHQRKYDKLVNVKKSMLEKMFPKNGETKPEIRFKGFTDDWEQRKLGEIAEETFGGGTPNTYCEAYWKGSIPWIQSSDLCEDKVFGVLGYKKISHLGIINSAAKIIPENSIAITTRVGVGKLSLIEHEYSTSQDFLSLSKLKIDERLATYLIYKKMKADAHLLQGTSIKGITKNEVLSKSLFVPKRIDEQNQIGNFFQKLDNLIALHQRRLEKLKNIKKSFLENMFV
ncbi:MAG: restriction endonuclease subunit S [Peptostreptococcaceae bacterium]|nr:restriction endonuclease subunit S [Peptostreptococcaceae bacterium]